MTAEQPTLSVAIVTYERPTFVRRCLSGLAVCGDDIAQIVVVDASARDDRACLEVAEQPAIYVWAPQLAGWMTKSRNRSLPEVTGDLVAFLDDDVVVHPGWARAVRDAFGDGEVSAVAGRTRNLLPGEDDDPDPVGRLLDDGTLTAAFAADRPAPEWVDHGIGANMSFRRSVLSRLGGFRDDYPGTAMREDTDIFLRIKALGLRTLFVPSAVVDHLPAEHVVGRRFDTRYKMYARRNHVVLLARYAGIGRPMVWRWVAVQLRAVAGAGGPVRVLQRAGVTVAGITWGFAAVARGAGRWRALDPVRQVEPLIDAGPAPRT